MLFKFNLDLWWIETIFQYKNGQIGNLDEMGCRWTNLLNIRKLENTVERGTVYSF